jgi:uncharacterized protein (UPF0332 family)
MNPRDFLTLAYGLAAGTTEAEWRSAVSRAYYAAFHAARQLLRDLGFRVPRGDQAHAYLWMRLSNCGDAGLVAAGQKLRDLRSDRNHADYDLDVPLPRASAPFRTGTADNVMQTLDTGRVEPTRTRITNAMRTYEQTVLRVVTWQVP